MCGMSWAGAGGAGRGGGSERDGKFVLRSPAGGGGCGEGGGGARRGRAPVGRGGAALARRSGCPPHSFATRGRSRPSCTRAPCSSPAVATLPTSPCTLGLSPPPQYPTGIWGSCLGEAEGGAPASGTGLPSVSGLGCHVMSPAEPECTGLGAHPHPPPSRAAEAERPLPRKSPPPTPGAQTRPRPGGCARPARTRFVWFSPRGLFLEFLLFPLFLDLRGPPSRPAPQGPHGGRLDTASPPSFGRDKLRARGRGRGSAPGLGGSGEGRPPARPPVASRRLVLRTR